MIIPIAQQFHFVSAAEVYLSSFSAFCSLKRKKRKEKKKVSLNPSLGGIKFDFILSEEGEDCVSSLRANVGHENK